MNDGRRRGKQVNKLSLLMMIDEADKDDSVVVQLTCLRPYLDLISVLFHGHRGIACPYSIFRDTGVSYCRLLLGDTTLKDDSFRTSDSPICDCGIERETADHFLLRCSRYSEARSVMKNYVYVADREIKSALFQFLKTVNLKV